MERRSTREFDIGTQVIVACAALETLMAGHARFDRDAITNQKTLHCITNPFNDPGTFVPQYVIYIHDEIANPTALPEMNVGSEGLSRSPGQPLKGYD